MNTPLYLRALLCLLNFNILLALITHPTLPNKLLYYHLLLDKKNPYKSYSYNI